MSAIFPFHCKNPGNAIVSYDNCISFPYWRVIKRTGPYTILRPFPFSMLFLCLFIYKMNKFIAFHYLKVFYDSRIKRFCLISEMFFHQQGKLLHGFGSIDLSQIKVPISSRWTLENLGLPKTFCAMVLNIPLFSISRMIRCFRSRCHRIDWFVSGIRSR